MHQCSLVKTKCLSTDNPGGSRLKRLALFSVLIFLISSHLFSSSVVDARRAAASTALIRVVPFQAQTPRPIRALPELAEVRVWLGYGSPPINTSFHTNHPALMTRLATLDRTSADIIPVAAPGLVDAYDVFYSDSDGTPNVNGAYVTVEAVYNQDSPPGGGLRLAEVALRFNNNPLVFEFGNDVASFVALGNNKDESSIPRAIDGNTATSTRMGNTIDQVQRLRLTVGFQSSSGPPISGLPKLFIEDAEVREGNTGTVNAVFRVRLSRPSTLPITVDYSTQDASAAGTTDYEPQTGTITFPPNSTDQQTINIQVRGDTILEADEAFFVNLSNPVNAALNRTRGLCLIQDDEENVLTFCSSEVPRALEPNQIVRSNLVIERDLLLDFESISLSLNHTALPGIDLSLGLPGFGITEFLNGSQGLVGTTLSDTCSPSPGCTVDRRASTSIFDASPPYNGRFQGTSDLTIPIRSNARGTWTLQVNTPATGSGTLNCWCVNLELAREGCRLIPSTARVNVFTPHEVRALLTANGAPIADQPVTFEVHGPQGELRLVATEQSNNRGVATLRYYDHLPGNHVIEARATLGGLEAKGIARVTWVADGLSGFDRCPFEGVFGGGESLTSTHLTGARKFRDEVLSKNERGLRYTRDYYRFSAEASRIILFNPMLMLKSREIIERYKPVIDSMVAGEKVVLTESEIDEIDEFLSSFGAKAGSELKRTLDEVRMDLRSPTVHSEFNIRITGGGRRPLSGDIWTWSVRHLGMLGSSFVFIGLLAAGFRQRSALIKRGRFLIIAALFSAIGLNFVSELRVDPRLATSHPHFSSGANPPSPAILFEAAQNPASNGFIARTRDFDLVLEPDQAVFQPGQRMADRTEATKSYSRTGRTSARMRFKGANANARGFGIDKSTSRYYLGNDPAAWNRVSVFSRVRYEQVYPGIDIVYYGDRGEIEYDFIVAPGASPEMISISFSDIQDFTIDSTGDLLLQTEDGQIRQRKPVVYQEIDGVRQTVESSYVLDSESSAIRFSIGDYDHQKELVIDPVLTYSSYLGGLGDDEGNAVTVDSNGNTYIAGFTSSTNFPRTAAAQGAYGGGNQDAFVMKLDSAGALVYSTYLGGVGQDNASAIVVDTAGNAYVTGFTSSGNFPVLNPLQQSRNGAINAFVTKLNPSGVILYSTYLGGNAGDFGSAVAVDTSGNILVAGVATSPNFPLANAIDSSFGGAADVFVSKLNPPGSQLIYSTYLGGSSNDGATAVATDSTGNLYITGVTSSPNFPVERPLRQTYGGGLFDGFVTKINPTGSRLVYSTFLGGAGEDRAFRIAVDAAGNSYLTGDTDSTDFPIQNAVQPIKSIGLDAFVTKINSSGTNIIYSTYLGGNKTDGATALVVDNAGRVHVAGFTNSANFPSIDPIQPGFGGGSFDGFIARLNASGAALDYSTYLGGTGIDAGFGLALDSVGNLHLMGQTSSTDFNTTVSIQPGYGGGESDLFLTRIGPSGAAGPVIDTVSLRGKKLVVSGRSFDDGAQVLVNGASQKTKNDPPGSTTTLVSKKAGKTISPGQTVTLRVRNANGTLSPEFSFTRPPQ